MATTDSYRDKLIALREELQAVAETGDEAAGVVELDQTRVGRLSRMDAMQAQSMSQEAQRRREAQLQAIEAALGRIDRDDYGYCKECEEPIDPRRLEFDPTALYCLECAAERDRNG